MKMNTLDERVLDQVPVSEPTHHNHERRIRFQFRWIVDQVGPDTVEVRIPTGGNMKIIDPVFVKAFSINPGQLEAAENAVLRMVAIVPE